MKLQTNSDERSSHASRTSSNNDDVVGDGLETEPREQRQWIYGRADHIGLLPDSRGAHDGAAPRNGKRAATNGRRKPTRRDGGRHHRPSTGGSAGRLAPARGPAHEDAATTVVYDDAA